MHIGDRVRLLHSKEEGVIRGIPDNRIVEIEIDDGFIIPVLRKELVLISQEEKEVFKKDEELKLASKHLEQPISDTGVYFGFEQKTDRDLDLYLINNTEMELLFRVFSSSGKSINGIAAGHMGSRSSKLITFLKLDFLDSWPVYHTDIMFFSKGEFKPVPAINRNIKFKPKLFTRKKIDAPIINKPCYLYQIDSALEKLDVEALKESLFEYKNAAIPLKEPVPVKSESVVDLHIETLVKNHKDFSKDTILSIQLEHFEKALNKALIKGIDAVTFIHGVGNGILRAEIHKRLGDLKEISYFEDAQKEKFGYGATRVFFK